MANVNNNPAVARVRELCTQGKRKEAVIECRRMCESVAATAEHWALYGNLAAETGDLLTAQKALEQAVALDPNLVEARLALGKVFTASGNHAAALGCLHEAAEMQPDNPDVWLALGIASGLAQRIQDAETCCRRSLDLRPDSAEARFNLANALLARGSLADAETEYEAALTLNPELTSGWSMLAQTRINLRKLGDADTALQRALSLDEDNGQAHFLLGHLLHHQGDKGQARVHLERAARIHPDIPDIHLTLGQLLYELEDFEQAVEYFQRVVNINPGAVEAHYMMGKCFEGRLLRGRAEVCYRKALAINNDHLQSHESLAFICARMDRHEESAKHFREVLRLNPNDDQARHLLMAQLGETTATAPATYVATLFDDFASTFDEKLVNKLGYRTPELLREMVAAHIPANSTSLDIIDLGCGTGLCAPLFRDIAGFLHGVDLSSGMLEKARERGLYDSLEINDIVASMATSEASWDLAVSADVLTYLGDLEDVFATCARVLRPGGWFAFSVEAGDDADRYVLRSTGRYAHACHYIGELARQTGFDELDRRAVILRKDKGLVDIHGYIYLLRLAAGDC